LGNNKLTHFERSGFKLCAASSYLLLENTHRTTENIMEYGNGISMCRTNFNYKRRQVRND